MSGLWLVEFSDETQFLICATNSTEAVAEAKQEWADEIPGRKAEDAPLESVEPY